MNKEGLSRKVTKNVSQDILLNITKNPVYVYVCGLLSPFHQNPPLVKVLRASAKGRHWIFYLNFLSPGGCNKEIEINTVI